MKSLKQICFLLTFVVFLLAFDSCKKTEIDDLQPTSNPVQHVVNAVSGPHVNQNLASANIVADTVSQRIDLYIIDVQDVVYPSTPGGNYHLLSVALTDTLGVFPFQPWMPGMSGILNFVPQDTNLPSIAADFMTYELIPNNIDQFTINYTTTTYMQVYDGNNLIAKFEVNTSGAIPNTAQSITGIHTVCFAGTSTQNSQVFILE